MARPSMPAAGEGSFGGFAGCDDQMRSSIPFCREKALPCGSVTAPHSNHSNLFHTLDTRSLSTLTHFNNVCCYYCYCRRRCRWSWSPGCNAGGRDAHADAVGRPAVVGDGRA